MAMEEVWCEQFSPVYRESTGKIFRFPPENPAELYKYPDFIARYGTLLENAPEVNRELSGMTKLQHPC